MNTNRSISRKPVRIVDLSIAIEPGLPSDPQGMIPVIDYKDHALGTEEMKHCFPGLTERDLPDHLGWATESVSLCTHSGTHLDAPYHYHPTMDRGRPALTIDEIPLEWCFGDGVLLDFRHKSDGDPITAEDLEQELRQIDYSIKPLDIVLIQTGADAAWGTSRYCESGAGMTRESTLYLTEKGVRVSGIDAWSWDRPLPVLARELRQTGNAKVIWEAHFAGMEIGYCHMEKMANLSSIGRPYGFTVCCFPIRIKRASAGWCRPVALIYED